MMLLCVLNFGCSTVGNQYGYSTKDLNGWEIGRCKDYGSTSYDYKCGESTYSICPCQYYDTSWIGPVPFPYVFPAFLMDKQKDKAFSGVKIRVYESKNSEKEIENFTPLIKLPDGKILRPSRCNKWETHKNIDYKFQECRYDVLVWDLSLFTLLIEGDSPKCKPNHLESKHKITGYYMSFPPPHTTIKLSE